MSIQKQYEESNNKRATIQNSISRMEGSIQSRKAMYLNAKAQAKQELGTDNIDEIRTSLTSQAAKVKELLVRDEVIFNLVSEFERQFNSGQVSEHLLEEISNTYQNFLAQNK
jgi:hypothetical protein